MRLKALSISVIGALMALAVVVQPATAAGGLLYNEQPFTSAELTNWTVDRALPSGGYESLATYQGKSNVLEMRLTASLASSSSFYKTEGLQRQIDASDGIKANLFVDNAWQGKSVRAGLWGVAKDGDGNVAAYPIVEYSTVDGFVGWRSYDTVTGDWHNLTGVAVKGDDWNNLSIERNSTGALNILVNGSVVDTESSEGAVSLNAVILNSKNFGTTGNDYAVHWANFAYAQRITKEQCMNGGWQTLNGSFKNQGQCVAFVVSNDHSNLNR
jgi:hypothetical protein